MLGRSEVSWILGAGFLAGFLLILSALFWQFALRFYLIPTWHFRVYKRYNPDGKRPLLG